MLSFSPVVVRKAEAGARVLWIVLGDRVPVTSATRERGVTSRDLQASLGPAAKGGALAS